MQRNTGAYCSAMLLTTLTGGVAAGAQSRYDVLREPPRKAIVVGTTTYKRLPQLPSVRLDAQILAEKLKLMQFAVTPINGIESYADFEDKLATFAAKVDTGDVVVVFLSGHGFSYQSRNWLAPADLPETVASAAVQTSAIAVEDVGRLLARRRPGFVFLVVDACRTVAQFVVAGEGQANLLNTVVAQDAQFSAADVNALVAYAIGPGKTAPSFGLDVPSPFSASVASRLDTHGVEVASILLKVKTDVEMATVDKQSPGHLSNTSAALFLSPKDSYLVEEDSVWVAALSEGTHTSIQRFLKEYSASRHAYAARLWLRDNAYVMLADDYSHVSPSAVENSWSSAKIRRAIEPSNFGLAFSRTIDVQANAEIGTLNRRALGVVGSGTLASLSTPDELRARIFAMIAHDTVVTTRSFAARAAPNASSSVVLGGHPNPATSGHLKTGHHG